MATPGVSSLALLSLWAVVLVVGPRSAYGSSRGPFIGRRNGAAAVADDTGICASSVTIHGYKCEEHEVTTQDGYILNMQRIPDGRAGGKSTGGKNKQPILIQHGVLVDGMTWFLNLPEENLPMILADNGFDVWICNTRGTRFSRKHVTLDPSEPDFWNWSWDELVSYDLPAAFDYVFNQTGQKTHYIGHSLGTLIGLTSFSEGHQAKTLKSAVFLSPIAYLSHMTTALGVVAAKAFLGEIITNFGLAEFDPKAGEVTAFLNALCNYPGVDCYDLLPAITGNNCCLNASTVNLFIKNEPQPTSTKNMVHLAQTVRNGVLSKYNYGRPDYNLMHYGEANPPAYNLSNIPHDLPIFMSYGGQDALSDIRDVQRLLDHLKMHDVGKLHVQYIKNFAHADFIFGTTAKDMVYNQVVQFFKNNQ